MAQPAGTRIGPYEIVSRLGAGGMSEVYRACDTKLNRDVAIKVLLPSVAADPDRLARFSREAQVLASLNHPNIAHIHGLEDAGGVMALILELVEGDDLAQRLARGPIPIDEALPIARQIAEALEAAHDHGIVHRDLKPANIKIRPDGTVKILDFGLAKAMAPDSSSADAMNSPTLSIHATQAGVILGTAAYMSPEQARGKPVDKRSDIWALACVLFEMLTGVRAFRGDDVTETIVSVMSREPAWNALTPAVPAGIRRLLRRCLEKDPKRRLDSAVAVRIAIDEALTLTASPVDANPATLQIRTRAVNRWTQLLPWGIAVAALVIAGAVVWRSVDRERLAPVYSSLDAPADYVLGEDNALASLPTRTPMVFTPDGRSLVIQVAHAGKPQLFLRSLDRPDARPIAGTDNAKVPFVSPDGKWVGFWSAGELRKVPPDGGAVTTVCTLKATDLGPYGAAWGTRDVIVFGDEVSGRIMRVPAGGGTPVPLTALPPTGRRQVAPFFFPDGTRILFSDVSRVDASDSRLMVQPLDGGEARLVIASAVDGRLLASGHLVFMRLGTLMTAPFDTARAEVTGDAVVAMNGVMQSGLRAINGAGNTAAGMFAVSSLGTLAFVRGPLVGPAESRLIWVTRDGRSTSAEPANGAPTGRRGTRRISPDGSRAIVAVGTALRQGLWLADWTRDTWTPCADCNSVIDSAIWSPDGARLLLSRNDTLVAHALDGSAPDQVLVQESGRALWPGSWRADGRIVYQSSDQTQSEIKLLEPGGHTGRVVVPLGRFWGPEVSPDGRWLAYTSAPASTGEVMVQAFPGPGSRTQVSAGGGYNPAWSADSRTLYYLGFTESGGLGGSAVVAVDIAASSVLTPGKPRELFRHPVFQGCGPIRCYDVSADGRRFLFRDPAPRASVTRMDLVQNWAATLPAADGRIPNP